ncbi:MAG: chromosome segregation protein SMC [Thermoplasmata archaeon]|nr:chromosome segregation protein SMC [Thermoplasmata archaeon]
MYLKKLDLENFKSFGKKTIIEFKKGFTGVSGPNGSGKSNISDAILFVLGPKSSKILRAQRLTDLIFNGGKDRKPADYCKVSLVFDNSDREIPVDSDEVTFTRIIKKSGEGEDYNSYFYINDEKAKLQDFTSLLSRAKIFADGYNIVQQGDITRIVEMSPLERRRILEEISGITKYDEQIADAERKKQETEDNMAKIEILIKEIESRLLSLENDRKTALRYLELKNELTKSRAALEYKKIKQLKSEIDGDMDEMNRLNKDIENLKVEIKKNEDDLKSKKEIFDRLNNEISKGGGDEHIKVKAQIDDIRLSLGKYRMRMEDFQARIDEINEELKILENQKKTLKKELDEKISKLKEIENKKNESEKLLAQKKNELKDLEDKITNSSKDLKEIQDLLNKRHTDFSEIKEILAKKNAELESYKENYRNIIEFIATQEEELKNLELNIKDAEWRMESVKDKEEDIKKRNKDLQDLYYTLKNKEVQLRENIQKVETKILSLSRLYEKYKAKIEMNRSMESVNSILEARDKGIIKGIKGTVRELIEVPKDLELAIDIAGGNRLDSLVVESDEIAAQCIDYLKQNKKGTATFLPINKMASGRPRGKALLAIKDQKAIGLILDLIKFEKEIEGPLWYVFSDTVAVEDLNTARKLMGGVRLVTRDGQLIEASGAITGGLVQRSEKSSNLGEMDNISKDLRNANIEKENLENEYKEVLKNLDQVSKEIQDLSKNRIEDVSVYVKTINENKEKLSKLKVSIENKYKEKRSLEEKLKIAEDEIKKLSEKAEFIERDINSMKIKLENFAPSEIQEKIRSLKNEIENIEHNYTAFTLLKKDLEHNIEDITKTINDDEKNIAKLENERKQKASDLENVKKEIEENEIKLRKFQEINASIEENIKKKWEEREKIQNEISNIELAIQRINEEINRKDDFIITLKSRINDKRNDLQESEKEFNSYGIEIKEPLPGTMELKKTIEYCESTMKSMEPINMKSIEEYDSENARLQDLKSNYSNLSEEKSNLIKLMNELNEKKKDGLLSVYRAIKENFSKIYSEITNGGEAVMYLENENDPFEGGLVIKARPKGKKMIRLEALSGGEKSLTALTFILAIQQYDPSPFYLFDESDMFLDGYNAENMARILKENSNKAQFIVVSLRRAVLKYSDNILGVTIMPDGISKVYEETYTEEVNTIGQ